MQDTRQFQKSISLKTRILRRQIGANIHTLRLRHHMPLKKLSQLSGLAPDTLDRLEMGKDEIGLDHLTRLSVALRVGVGAFLEGAGGDGSARP